VSVSTRYETIRTPRGESFEAFCAVPESGSGPGILLFQEVFGINDNMRGLAEKFAGAGFVALVPDMFWRIEPRFERKDESGLGDAFALMAQFDFEAAVDDIRSAHAHLLSMREGTGQVGAVGFCLGGGLAFAAATLSRIDGRGVDAAVCYYGSGVNDLLGHVEHLECPCMFHYGRNDQYIPADKVLEVERAAGGRPGVEFHFYEAGHAFSNWDAPSMYDRAAADEAWARTVAFFGDHLS
jgi:carboxymethylenebutenolidase